MAYPSGPHGSSGPSGTPPEGYGPPPQPFGGLGPNPGQFGPGQQPQAPQQRRPPLEPESVDWTPAPELSRGKGFVGSLFDLNFDYMVTTRLIRLVYVIALVGITVVSLIIAWYGLGILLQWNGPLGVMVLVAAPCLWLFWTLATRMLMEFLINQFKISEYLRSIKDKL